MLPRDHGHQPAVGDVAAVPLPGGGYGAVQVCGVFIEQTGPGPHVVAYGLDWHSEAVPSLDQLTAAEPLRGGPADELVHIGVSASWPPPVSFVWLGTQPVRPDVPDTASTFSGWEWLAGTAARHRRWDALPVALKQAYVDARDDRQVEVDLGAGPVLVSQTVHELRCVAADAAPFANPRMAQIPTPAAEVWWSALDALPQLNYVHWSGPDRGLVAALAAHPLVSELVWHDPPETADLSSTNLTRLELVSTGMAEARLPPGLLHLALVGGAPTNVVAADDGRWLALAVRSPDPALPEGLTGVRTVYLTVNGTVVADVLADLTNLERLQVSWTKPPGTLERPATLARFSRLHTIKLSGAYGLAAEDLPTPAQMPALERFEVDGLRSSVAAALRSRLRGTQIRLTVRGAKNDTWLAANLTNPFRDWVEDHPRAGAAAVKVYATAMRAIDAIRGNPDGRTDAARAALQTMVAGLNRIEERYRMIDTVRCEEAFDACVSLAQRAGVPKATVAGWFDEWRDF